MSISLPKKMEDVYTSVLSLYFKFENQLGISDALRLRKYAWDSKCFYSVNAFELCKEAKRERGGFSVDRER